jgi:uncharacterized protein YjiS (DUF1127 family)
MMQYGIGISAGDAYAIVPGVADADVLAMVRPPRALQALARLLLLWRRRDRERRELAALDDRSLRDIGLNRAEVAYESTKPFWRS